MTQTPKSTGPLLVTFGILTALYLAVPIYLGYTAHGLNANCVGLLPCLTPSEWGDFLSGAFAPLAFLWLVAAVLIQSAELREQRNELVLTRKEFESNRSVMEQQAEEAKRQAEYIATQTRLLSEEAVQRKRAAALESFLSLVSKYVGYTKENREELYYRVDSFSGQRDLLTIVGAASDEHYIRKNYLFLCDGTDSVKASIEVIDNDIFESAFIYLYGAEEILENIPYDSRVYWKRSKLASLLGLYCKIIVSLPQFEHLKGHVEARGRRLEKRGISLEVGSSSPDD